MNLRKFEALKPSRSGSCEAAILFSQKYDFHPQNTHTSCVYFDIKSSKIIPIFQDHKSCI